MTRLYTEAAMLEVAEKSFEAGQRNVQDTLRGAATILPKRLLQHIVATATTVAAPDLSRLAEAVREAAVFKLDQARHEPGRTLHESQAFDVARAVVRSIDLAPIVAASGTGEAVVRTCGDCEHFGQDNGVQTSGCDHPDAPDDYPGSSNSHAFDSPPWCPLRKDSPR